MFEIEELIKQVSIDISIPSKKFVYFDKETGFIKSISSKKISEESCIEVETSKITNILNGIRSTNDFLVKYDDNLQKYIIHDNKETTQFLNRDFYLYEIPKYSKDSIVFKREFLGIYVDVWYDELEHFAGQHVWYDYSVYRILENQPADTEFDLDNAELIVDCVKLYNDNNKYLNFDRKLKRGDLILDYNKIYSVHEDSSIIIKPEIIDKSVDIQKHLEKIYEGIFVDIWYKELSHVAGQHVWYDGVVYKIIADQNAGTDFDIDNVDLVLSNVKLIDDSNKSLDFDLSINSGDHVLSNNYLYLSRISNVIKNKSLDKEIDLYIKQHNKNNFWSFALNERTKTALKNNRAELNNTIFFGITLKEDPNRLYRLFKINLKDLVDKSAVTFKYQFKFEFDNEEVSIYTSKYFKEYSYEVIQ